jgi:hypothetical protein
LAHGALVNLESSEQLYFLIESVEEIVENVKVLSAVVSWVHGKETVFFYGWLWQKSSFFMNKKIQSGLKLVWSCSF